MISVLRLRLLNQVSCLIAFWGILRAKHGNLRNIFRNYSDREDTKMAKTDDNTIDINAPVVPGIRGWKDRIALRVDGSHPRWKIENDNEVRLNDDNTFLVIDHNGKKTELKVNEIQRVMLQPLSRFQGYTDVKIRTVHNGKISDYYGGTLRGGSTQYEKAVSIFRKVKLI